MIQLQNQTSLTLTPSGEFASIVLEYDDIEDYCTIDLEGRVCGQAEYCEGEEIEYYPAEYCCKGVCRPSPHKQVLKPEEIVDQETYDPDSMTEEDLEAIDALVEEEAVEIPVPEEIPAETKEPLERMKEAVEKVSSRINFLHVALIIAGVLFVVFVSLAFFRRSAEHKIEESDKAARQRPVQQTPNLQPMIDSFISKGYSYKQARQSLIDQGHTQDIVDAEIRKNYESRKAGTIK